MARLEHRIYVNSGAAAWDEAEAVARKCLDQSVVVDGLTLAIMLILGLKEVVGRLFKRIVVPMAFLDEINRALATLEDGRTGDRLSVSLQPHSGQLRVSVLPQQQRESAKSFFKEVHAWLVNHCETLASGARYPREDLRVYCHPSVTDAFEVAAKRGLPIVSEDGLYADYARGALGTARTFLGAVLNVAASQGTITINEKANAFAGLLAADEWFIRVDAETLLASAEEHQFQNLDKFEVLLRALRASYLTTEASALQVASELLAKIVLHDMPTNLTRPAMVAVVNALLADRPKPVLAQALFRVVRHKTRAGAIILPKTEALKEVINNFFALRGLSRPVIA